MNYKDINDYELLYLIKEDKEYYETIMLKKYYPLINQFILKYQNLAKPAGLEEADLLQIGYLALYDAIKKYQDNSPASFSTFCYICIKRRILNAIRTATSGKNIILNNSISINYSSKEGYSFEDVLPSSDNVEKEILQSELYKTLNDFKWELPNKECVIFELYLNSFKIREIAVLLDCSPQAISTSILRIRKKLKNYLQLLGLCYN